MTMCPWAEGPTAHLRLVGVCRGPSCRPVGSSTLYLQRCHSVRRVCRSTERNSFILPRYFVQEAISKIETFRLGLLLPGWANHAAGPGCLEPVAGRFSASLGGPLVAGRVGGCSGK